MKIIHSRGVYETPTVSVYENVDVILSSVIGLTDGDIGGRDIFEASEQWF
jgi:hypothetical protein